VHFCDNIRPELGMLALLGRPNFRSVYRCLAISVSSIDKLFLRFLKSYVTGRQIVWDLGQFRAG
jgi:hypothetical protein